MLNIGKRFDRSSTFLRTPNNHRARCIRAIIQTQYKPMMIDLCVLIVSDENMLWCFTIQLNSISGVNINLLSNDIRANHYFAVCVCVCHWRHRPLNNAIDSVTSVVTRFYLIFNL